MNRPAATSSRSSRCRASRPGATACSMSVATKGKLVEARGVGREAGSGRRAVDPDDHRPLHHPARDLRHAGGAEAGQRQRDPADRRARQPDRRGPAFPRAAHRRRGVTIAATSSAISKPMSRSACGIRRSARSSAASSLRTAERRLPGDDAKSATLRVHHRSAPGIGRDRGRAGVCCFLLQKQSSRRRARNDPEWTLWECKPRRYPNLHCIARNDPVTDPRTSERRHRCRIAFIRRSCASTTSAASSGRRCFRPTPGARPGLRAGARRKSGGRRVAVGRDGQADLARAGGGAGRGAYRGRGRRRPDRPRADADALFRRGDAGRRRRPHGHRQPQPARL